MKVSTIEKIGTVQTTHHRLHLRLRVFIARARKNGRKKSECIFILRSLLPGGNCLHIYVATVGLPRGNVGIHPFLSASETIPKRVCLLFRKWRFVNHSDVNKISYIYLS